MTTHVPPPVVAKRLLGFDAGPQNQTFYACIAHVPLLEKGDVSCFHRLKDRPVISVDGDEREDNDCYFCREG